MAKKNKREAVDKITKSDALEVQVSEIAKGDSDSKKRQLLNEFIRHVEGFIKDQRDVLLIGVKIR